MRKPDVKHSSVIASKLFFKVQSHLLGLVYHCHTNDRCRQMQTRWTFAKRRHINLALLFTVYLTGSLSNPITMKRIFNCEREKKKTHCDKELPYSLEKGLKTMKAVIMSHIKAERTRPEFTLDI